MTRGMLSRLAELLYWTGRYVERADDTSRIVDAYIHRIAEDPFGDPDAACHSLFATLGMRLDKKVSVSQEMVLQKLVYDEANPSSITGALLTAHENARRAREAISSEMWICLNATRNDLTTQRVRASRVGPASYLHFIRERSALFAGLTDATISHDEAWWYLVLGRSLERIDMTARLLESRLLAEQYSPDWLTLLRAAGAMESYLRVSTGGSDPQAIAAFLLLDRAFPRSAFHSLNTADLCLQELTNAGTRSSAVNQARRTIRTAQTRLEYSEPGAVLDELEDILEMLEQTSAAANDQITEYFFRHVISKPWASEAGL
jgi:uncharacterized alpha-E superfamily protein